MEITELYARDLDAICAKRKAHDFYARIQSLMPSVRRLYDSIRGGQVTKLSQRLFSYEEGEALAFEFYKKLDKGLYEKLVDTLRAETTDYNHHDIMDEVYYMEGENSCGNSNGRIHVEINPAPNAEGLEEIVHEFAHVLAERSQCDKRPKDDCLGEIESKFMEKLYEDRLLTCEIITQEEYDTLQEIKRISLRSDCECLLQENDILHEIKPPITQEKILTFLDGVKSKYGEKDYNLLKDCLDMLTYGDGMNNHGEYKFRYVVGEVVARALYVDWRNDPTATLDKFKSFLEVNADITLQEALPMLLGENAMEKLQAANFPQEENEQ